MKKGNVTNLSYILENGIKIPKGLPLIQISKLRKNPQNIKRHSKEQIHDIAELMKMVGFKDPMVIDEDFLIWAGHGRLESAELLGMKRVPYIYLDDLTEDQKKVFLIMDNKVNESPWVSENLKIIFDEVDPILFDEFKMNFDDYFQKNMELSEQEWQGMPEFIQESQEAYRVIFVKFKNEKNIKKFADIINQDITNRTKSIWFPYRAIKKTDKEYTDES